MALGDEPLRDDLERSIDIELSHLPAMEHADIAGSFTLIHPFRDGTARVWRIAQYFVEAHASDAMNTEPVAIIPIAEYDQLLGMLQRPILLSPSEHEWIHGTRHRLSLGANHQSTISLKWTGDLPEHWSSLSAPIGFIDAIADGACGVPSQRPAPVNRETSEKRPAWKFWSK